MTALFGIGKRGAFSLLVGSLRGQYRGSFKYPSCFVPITSFSTRSGEEEDQESLKKKKRLKSNLKRDELIVFVNVPSLPPLEAVPLDGEKKIKIADKRKRTKQSKNDHEHGSANLGKDRKKKKQVIKSENVDDTSIADEHPEQEKKKKQVNKKSKNANKGSTVDGDADNNPETETKKKRVKKRKSEQSDEEIKSSLLGSFVPFEGTPVDNVNDQHLQNTSVYSMDRQDLPEGRFYHLKSSTGSYSFPSVTTILDNTMEGSSYYRLLKWRQKLTGEHGAKGFDTIRKTTLNSGHSFHKKLESRLQKLQSQKEIVNISSTASASAVDKIATAKAEVQEGVNKDPVNDDDSVFPQPVIRNDVTWKSEHEVGTSSSSGTNLSNMATIGDSGDSDDARLEGLSSSVETTSDPIEDSDEAGLEDEEDSLVTEDERHSLADILPSSDPKYMQSVEHVLADIGKIKALETSVAHLQLGYMGTFDCLAQYKGTLCLIDWKTSNKPKPSLADCYDYPLQAVAYAGAINQDPHMQLKVLNVLIVIAYGDGAPAHAHFVTSDLCQKYWLKWLQRLQKYQTQFSEDLTEIIT